MPERLRLRTSPWRLLPGVLILPLFITQLALTGAPGALVAALALFLVLIGVASVAWFGITLTPDAAVVHGFGRRRVPWSEVQAVTVERYVIESWAEYVRLRSRMTMADSHLQQRVAELQRADVPIRVSRLIGVTAEGGGSPEAR